MESVLKASEMGEMAKMCRACQVQVSNQKLAVAERWPEEMSGSLPGETGLSNADPSLVPALHIKLLTIH